MMCINCQKFVCFFPVKCFTVGGKSPSNFTSGTAPDSPVNVGVVYFGNFQTQCVTSCDSESIWIVFNVSVCLSVCLCVNKPKRVSGDRPYGPRLVLRTVILVVASRPTFAGVSTFVPLSQQNFANTIALQPLERQTWKLIGRCVVQTNARRVR